MTDGISIVLVTYNSADWLERCLASLPSALAGRAAELIVVDNGSADESVGLVRELRPDAKIIANTGNLGFAAAVNTGARRATMPWILLLNPDTESRPGSLDALVRFAENYPGHGIYGGRTLNPDGTVQPSSCWNLPTLWSTACFGLGLVSLFPHTVRWDPESIGNWPRDTVREVGMVTGCLLLVPTEVWRELNGLDERYFVYGEDADFAARARAAGYAPIVTPAAEIVHEVGASSADGGAKVVLLLAGKVTFLRTHLPPVQARIALMLLRFGVAWRSVGARLTGHQTRWRAAWAARDRWWHGYPTTGTR